MGKSSSKSQVKTKLSGKTTNKQTVSKVQMDSPLKGSLGRFFGFFIPGMGFGGAFIIISIIILAIFFWMNQKVFCGSEQKWQVVFNPPPIVWEQFDVLQDVQNRQSELFDIPFDDPNLLEDLSNAFNLVSIVKKVNSVVRRYPNQIILDLDYFVPVGLVLVHARTSTPGYLPIDKDGYQLPTQPYIKKSDIQEYITIHGIESEPVNIIGHKWGDIRVELAAKIANELMPYKKEFSIVNILVHEGVAPPNEFYNPTLFDVHLANNTYIRWNTAVIKQTGELTVQDPLPFEEKIRLLKERLHMGNGVIQADHPNEILLFEPNKTEQPQK